MKLFFLDTETTGLNYADHSLVQLGGIIDIDGKVEELINIKCSPFPNDKIDEYALKTQNVTEAELLARQSPKDAYKQFTNILGKYIDKYDTKDKFTIIGYNVNFDADFLNSWFTKNEDKYFGSWFNRRPLDVMSLAYYYRYKTGIELDNWKLKNVCDYFKIPLVGAHDAFADVNSTRDLFYKIDKELS